MLGFTKGSKKNQKVFTNYLVATIYNKIEPFDRGTIYEDPLNDFLKKSNIGEITGSGTKLAEPLGTGIEYIDLEIRMYSEEVDNNAIQQIINKLEEIGAPMGSKLLVEKTGEEIKFGKFEGMSVHISYQSLPAESTDI